MARADLLVVHATQLLTLRGPNRARRGREMRRLGIVRDGALAVREGRIVGVGRTRDVRSRFAAPQVLDVEGRAVVPGFVDAHTHLPFAGSRAFELELKLAGRSYLQILRAGGGIHRTVRDTRAATLGELVALVRERMDVMLRWGTTTAEAKSGYGLTVADELKQLRAVRLAAQAHAVGLVPTLLAAHVVPPEFARRRAEYVRLITRQMIPTVARAGLAEFCDAFLERGAFAPAECAGILGEAKRYGLGRKLHADEFTNQRGAELAVRTLCTSAEHLLRASARGIRALAGSPTLAVLLPGVSITSFLDRFAPGRRMVDAGVGVALGTDFNPNCPVLTMPTVLQWACYHLRLRPAEALAAGTVNAAYALGRGDRVGSLEVGKSADAVILESAEWMDLVYRLGSNPVWATMAGGRPYRATGATSKPRSHRLQ